MRNRPGESSSAKVILTTNSRAVRGSGCRWRASSEFSTWISDDGPVIGTANHPGCRGGSVEAQHCLDGLVGGVDVEHLAKQRMDGVEFRVDQRRDQLIARGKPTVHRCAAQAGLCGDGRECQGTHADTSETARAAHGCEFPQLDPRRSSREHRFSYVAEASRRGGTPDSIVTIDHQNGGCRRYTVDDGSTVCELLFAAEPDADGAEGRGDC